MFAGQAYRLFLPKHISRRQEVRLFARVGCGAPRPDRIGQMRAPLLVMVAGADFTPVEEFERFDKELSEAGVPHSMHIYDGAPHSFFDRSFAEHQAACDDAWRRMLDFVGAAG